MGNEIVLCQELSQYLSRRAFVLYAQEEMPGSHEKTSRFLLVHFWMLAAWVHCANWSRTYTPVGGREGGIVGEGKCVYCLGGGMHKNWPTHILLECIRSDQIRSVTQSCPTLCDPMNRSTPGLPVHHQILEFTQTHVHRVSDAIQPSHPLSSPSPLAPNPSQHQSLFQ